MVILKAIGSVCTSAAATVANATEAANEAAKYAAEQIKLERIKSLAEAAKEVNKADLEAVKALQDVLKQLD